ncbi:MAG: autotransporter-associated beta strand repeat-containing protein, partial [Opitutales bacterium]
TKSGNGTLSLSGANTLAGNLTVSAGALSLTGSGSLGNGGTVSVNSGATLSIGTSVSDSQTGLITNAGTLTNAGSTARSVVTSGTFTNTGTAAGLTVNTGGLVTNTGTLADVTLNNGTLSSTGTVGAVSATGGSLRLSGTAGAVSLATDLNVGGLASTNLLSASSLALSNGSVLEFELSDVSNSSFYDRLSLSGALDLSGLTSSATLKLFSFDRAAGARGAATVFNQYTSFTLDILTAGSVTGSTEFTGDLGDTIPALALDVSGFTNTYSGDWALVAHSGGYRLEYTANIPVVDVTVATLAGLSDSTEGTGFLSELAGGQTAQVLRKFGAGQLTVTEALDHIGGTQVKGGMLLLADGAALGSGDVTIDDGATLEFANTGTFANSVAGAGDIHKSGSGSLELTGAVAITGNLLVEEGTLAANFAPLGGTLEILSGATADFKGLSGQTFSGNLAGAGTARLAGGNTLTLSASNNSFTGLFTVDNGTLILAANNALGTGSAEIASGSTLTVSGAISLASGFTGAGALTKTGAGTATLTGSIAHTGTTTVSAGTLKGDFTNASGAIAVDSGATLEYAIGSDATRGGSDITGAGSLTKSGNGKLTLSSAVGLTGGVTIAGGTLAASDFGTASSFTINSGATAELTQASAGTLATVFGGSGTFTKVGNGTLTVGSTGLSTFTGKLRVAQGTVATAAIANIGTTASSIELDGGALAVTASGQTIGSTRAITIGSNGATLNTSSLGQTGTLTVDGLISGTGTLTLASSGNTSATGGGDSGRGIVLTNTSNSFTGDVVITSGLVNYTSNAVFGNAANKIVLNGGGLLETGYNATISRNLEVQSGGGVIRYYGNTASTFSGSLSGTGTLRRTDGGTLTFTGDVSGFSGTLTNDATTDNTMATLFTGSSPGLGSATVNITVGTVGFATGRVGSATVNLDGGTLRFESAGTVASTASVKLVSGKAGTVNTNGNDVTLANGITGSGTNLSKSGSGTLVLQGAGTATLSGAVNANAGTLEIAGQAVSAVNNSVDGGTLKISSGTNTATNLYVASGTLTIAGGTTTVGFFRTSDYYGNSNSTINQTGGTFSVTGSTIENERGNSFLLNHWSGTSTYNLSGGTLNVLNTNINMGWDGSAYVNQSGGTANVRGVNMASGRSNAAAYNLTGGRLNIGVGGITSAANKTFTAGDATLGALGNWTGASSIAISSGKTLTVDTADAADGTTARTITLSGGLTGAGSLTKVGNGTLNLTGASTMTGSVTVNAGTLGIGATMQGISGLTINSGATASTSANNFFSAGHGAAVAATLTVNGGTFLLGSGTEGRLGNINLNGGTFTSNRGLASYDILLANLASGAATVTVGGSSASTMNGSGGLHLQGVQNFNVANATADSAADLVVSLQLSDGGVYVGGAGGINKTGQGTMSLTNAANNFTGDITVGAGRLEVSGSGRLNAGNYAGAISNSGELAFTGTATQTLSGAITNTGDIAFGGEGNRTLSGVVSGAGTLTKSGNGALTISGANTRTGDTQITGGSVNVTATGSLGSGNTTVANANLSVANGGSVGSTLSLDGSTLSFADSQTFATSITGGANGVTLATSSNDVTLSGVVTAADDVTKTGAGTLTLSGSGHSVGGVFNINAGTVALSSLSDVTGAFNIGANGMLSLSLNLATDASFDNLLTGSGILSVDNLGSGVFSLGNATGFSSGTLNLLSGSFDNTGFTGKVNLLGGFLANLENFTGSLSIGSQLTEQQEQALAGFTGTLELGDGVTVDITKINTGANLVVGEGATIDFSAATPEQLSRTITLSGNATLQGAENFTGVVQVAAGSNVTIGTGSIGGGSLEIATGATVTITAPIENTVVFTGGTIIGGANLTTLELTTGSLTFGSGGNIDTLADTAVLTVAGGTVNFAGQAVAATIEFSGGTVSNAENFAGTLAVVAPADLAPGETINFVMNGTIGGTITAGSNTVIGGNGTFNTLTMGAGSNFSPGSSPGANTVGNLSFAGGSTWTLQFYSAEGVISSGPDAGLRGYDTTTIAVPEGSLNNPVFDLSGASSSSRITLKLMTLSNWSDNTGGLPTSLLDVPMETGYIDFVIATYGDGVLNMGTNPSLSALFQFNTNGFYKSDGTRAYSGNFSIFEYYNAATGLNELTLRYSAVPEPSTYGLILGGLALAAAAYRRRQRKQA